MSEGLNYNHSILGFHILGSDANVNPNGFLIS